MPTVAIIKSSDKSDKLSKPHLLSNHRCPSHWWVIWKHTERNRAASVSFPEPWHDSCGNIYFASFDGSHLQQHVILLVITENIKTTLYSIYKHLSLNWSPKLMISSSDTFWCWSIVNELLTDSVGWPHDCFIYYFEINHYNNKMHLFSSKNTMGGVKVYFFLSLPNVIFISRFYLQITHL